MSGYIGDFLETLVAPLSESGAKHQVSWACAGSQVALGTSEEISFLARCEIQTPLHPQEQNHPAPPHVTESLSRQPAISHSPPLTNSYLLTEAGFNPLPSQFQGLVYFVAKIPIPRAHNLSKV